MDKIIIRSAEKCDIPFIEAVENDCFSLPWSAKSIESELANADAVMLVAQQGTKVIGWGGFRLCLDEADITNIAVLKEYRGNGAGKALTQGLVGKAWEMGAVCVILEVRASNGLAVEMYKKAGFQAIGVRPGFYEKPREDALMMRTETNHDNI